MISIEDTSCCGLKELSGIEGPTSPKTIVETVAACQCSDNDMFAFVLFTCRVAHTGGAELAKYIRSERIGVTVKTRKARNPNSGNEIQCWIWRINRKALWKWAKEHGVSINYRMNGDDIYGSDDDWDDL